jgi:uncharacterized membrane protein
LTLAPFYAASIFVKIHILAALMVAALTPLQFWGFRKGSLPHRISGYAWLTAMLVVAISSFWITSHFPFSIAGFSPIHILSGVAPFSIWRIIQTARSGQMKAHFGHVCGLAIGFWIAGALTFVPPRILGRMFYG